MKQNKLLALILALVMAGGTFPSTALAAEITDTADNASDNTSVQVQNEVSSESNSLFKDSFSSKKKSQEKLPEASKETFGDFEYTIDTSVDEITITKYNGSDVNVVIPNEINGYPVTKIGNRAFQSMPKAVTVTIPDGITCVDEYAFYGCERLESADLPDSVEVIGTGTFQNCQKLASFKYPKNWKSVTPGWADGNIFVNCEKITKITVPEGVESIPARAFENAGNLQSVVLPSTLKKIGNNAFRNCTAIKEFSLPDSVEEIGVRAFNGCNAVKEMTLPSSLETLGERAFESCGKLENVVFNNGLITIGYAAFYNCERLKAAELPDSVEVIGRYAFENCKNLASFHYPLNWEKLDSDGSGGIFKNCENLTSITVPEGIKILPNYAFDEANCLTSAELPSTLTTIGYSSFRNCSSLSKIVIPDSVKTIGAEAFKNSGLKTVKLPEAIEKIDSRTFQECKSLTSVEFPSELIVVGYGAFYSCERLTSVNLPNTVEEIDGYAFANCKKLASFSYPTSWEKVGDNGRIFENDELLTSITVPEGIKTIPDYAFNGANCLTSVKLPSTLTKLGRNSFSWCTSLTSAELPDSIKTIGEEAFKGSGLTKVKLPATLEKIDSRTFQECKSLTSVEFPSELKIVGYAAFDLCEKLTSISLPNTVEEIGGYAFSSCKKLTSFSYPTSWEKVGNDGRIFENDELLTSITVPEGIKTIPDYAFNHANCLTSVKLPSTLTKLGRNSFSWCTSLTSVELSDSIKTIGEEAFKGSGLTTVKLPASLENIESRAFQECKSLEAVEFPSKLKSVGYGAFDQCIKLGAAELPDSVTSIGRYAFSYCPNLTSFRYPAKWETVIDGYEGRIFENDEALTTITIPEGVKSIPDYAFDHSNYLVTVNLPSTITKIGTASFRGCERLKEFTIPPTISSVGERAFESCPILTIYCPKYINSVISFIDGNINVVSNEDQRIDNPKVLEEAQSSYVLYSGSKITVNCSYAIKNAVYGNVSDLSVRFYIPNGAMLSDGSLYLNGELCTDFQEDNNHITIPVSKRTGKITFSLVTDSDCRLQSYAILNYKLGSSNSFDIIDIVNEDYELLTLNAEDIISSTSIEVSGIASASKDVELYVNGNLKTSVQANKAGSYNAVLDLGYLFEGEQVNIRADMVDKSGNTLSAQKLVKYSENAPELSSLDMEYNGLRYDLLSGKKHNVTFIMESHGGSRPFKFTANYKNAENIKRVYITSTRNQVTKKMQAFYDKKVGAFVANGFFDENDHDYVPGKIGVQYLEKSTGVQYTLNDLDTIYSTDVLPEALKNSGNELIVDEENRKQVVITAEDGDQIVYTYERLSLSEFKKEYESTHKFTRKADNTEKGIAKDLIDYGWNVQTEGSVSTYAYFDKNANANQTIAWSYQTSNDYVEKETIDFGGRSLKKIELLKVSEDDAKLMIALGLNYVRTEKTEYINLSGYVIDYNSAKNDIMSSSLSPEEKKAKLEYLNELRRVAIELTAARLVGTYLNNIGGYKFGTYPVLSISIYVNIICIYTNPNDKKPGGVVVGTPDNPDPIDSDDTPNEESDIEDMATGNTSFVGNCLSFAIDPSGIVYEAVTSNRVAGATVTAYWIPFDENDAGFWNNPDESKSIIWNADEYSQINPLTTDADGNYAWDVPEGWWKVVVEKSGYETISSDWMTVPPPQTNVNIALVSKAAPKVENVEVNDKEVTVTFSKYIDPATVSGIKLTDENGSSIEYTLEYSKIETNAQGTVYAKTFKLVLASNPNVITLNVPNTVKSYSGTSVTEYNEKIKNSTPKPDPDPDPKPKPDPDPDPDPKPKPDPDPKPQPDRIYGDLDNDNEITSADSLLILRQSVGLENFDDVEQKLADVDGDESITSADALEVLRYSVGLPATSNIGEKLK